MEKTFTKNNLWNFSISFLAAKVIVEIVTTVSLYCAEDLF